MIEKISDTPNIIFSLITKAFLHEGGSLTLISIPISIGIKNLFYSLFAEITHKDITLPLFVFATCFLMFVLVTAMDFYTGISASKFEHKKETGTTKGFLKSDRLWSSIWKIQGVILVAVFLLIFNYIFLVLDKNTWANIFQYGTVLFFIVVILFDIHSIGENHERRHGKKPAFYIFLDDISKAIRMGIIQKISSTFSVNKDYGPHNNHDDDYDDYKDYDKNK